VTSAAVRQPASKAADRYLTFLLGQESYGVPVIKVREIIKLAPVTPVPQLPAYVKGVINLRGKIIPVVDLRAKFALPAAETDHRACIVVAHIETGRASSMLMGLTVDAVEEVSQVAASEIEDAPDFGREADSSCIQGLAKVKGSVKILLDLDRALGSAAAEASAAGVVAGGNVECS
jgi:purine-binding chemotaxis protein CheW